MAGPEAQLESYRYCPVPRWLSQAIETAQVL